MLYFRASLSFIDVTSSSYHPRRAVQLNLLMSPETSQSYRTVPHEEEDEDERKDEDEDRDVDRR